jgi:hypothetical protein
MIAFRIHMAGTLQSGLSVGYNLVNWAGVEINEGSRWMSDGNGGYAFCPVLENEDPAYVLFGGQTWVSGPTTESEPQYVAKVLSNTVGGSGFATNATEVLTGIGGKSNFDHTWVHRPTGLWRAEPGDMFKLFQYVSSTSTYIDGHPMHTWWEGVVL